jgi:hypothetical protein
MTWLCHTIVTDVSRTFHITVTFDMDTCRWRSLHTVWLQLPYLPRRLTCSCTPKCLYFNGNPYRLHSYALAWTDTARPQRGCWVSQIACPVIGHCVHSVTCNTYICALIATGNRM